MFILNPDPYYLPCYRIGPFRTEDLSRNNGFVNSDLFDDYLRERFGDKRLCYTYNGRQAIDIALSYYDLRRDDVITILTTTGNYYISSCVTSVIERYCRWSRELNEHTKVIFVNHEFGYPLTSISQLRELGLPIIEDCASSFFSFDQNRHIGEIGDFVIYSFPKMFPLQFGGLLVSNKYPLGQSSLIDTSKLKYLKNVLSNYIQQKEDLIAARIRNYVFLAECFRNMGFSERFQLQQGVVPGVFMFKTEGHDVNLPELKKHFWSHGIQCSVFYGEDAFFIPAHQALDEQDMLYFRDVMLSFLNLRI